jgi:3-carboxy-cis,cis-muconate cycloisomerase
VLQFGGAAGSLASLGDAGPAVSAYLADDLNLREPDLSWHAHRDRLVDLAAALGLFAGVLGKIARDISLMMQTEVGEVSEPSASAAEGPSDDAPTSANPSHAPSCIAAGGPSAVLVRISFGARAAGTRAWARCLAREWETACLRSFSADVVINDARARGEDRGLE